MIAADAASILKSGSGSYLQAALDYAGRGLPVFPCVPREKIPATKRGFNDATTNPATIRRWWQATEYNIGLRTGEPAGMWVVDIDGHDGADSLSALEAEHGVLPQTAEVITARGRHLWFKYTAPISCSTGRVGPGIDVRGDGGCIMAPPSIHPTGQLYTWWTDRDCLAAAPDWLIDLTRKKPVSISERALANIRPFRNFTGSPDAYGRAALENEIATLARTPPGARNHALNAVAFSLFQLVAGGELDEREVLDRLIGAAHANGLMVDPDDGPRKVAKTIESGRRAGMQNPRSRSGAE
jgi:hypothetical protein